MRIIVAAVGKLKLGPETELSKRYTKRFDGSGRALGLGPLEIVELTESRNASAALRKKDEAQRLLDKVSDNTILVALDERGTNYDSKSFAEMIASVRDDGADRMAFLIGGPDGHGEPVLKTAAKSISLGAMTLPHGLARIILLEQLYRATTILNGHPYHRA